MENRKETIRKLAAEALSNNDGAFKKLRIHDEINKVIFELSRAKEEVYKKALNHFLVEIEQIPDRVEVYYGENSIEQVFIDQKLALTFSPLQVDLDGKIKMDYKEHYLGL